MRSNGAGQGGENDNVLKNNYYYALTNEHASNPPPLSLSYTGIANSCASGFFFAHDAPASNQNHYAPTIGVWLANGLSKRSIASATLALVPSLPPLAMQGHVMPSFTNSLIGLGPFVNMLVQKGKQDLVLFHTHGRGLQWKLPKSCSILFPPAFG